MSEPGEERKKIEESIAALEAQRPALGNAVVDPALAALRAQLCASKSQSKEPTTTDERKSVTVLFSDISGFTALSEKLDPEEVHRLINGCFDRLVPIVKKYDGTIDKFIGDEIMALFGAPIAHEDDPERALRAALEMMDAIAAFNGDQGTNFGMHIGINTGRVVAGKVGTEGRRDYSVMGDSVNVAARLEAASEVGEIFVGPTTYEATANLFEFERVPPLVVKGKEAPLRVHRLVAAKKTVTRERGIRGLRAPLTGRDHEFHQIRASIQRLQTGRGCLVTIVGEAGLGKSRLIAEARSIVPANTTWAEGRALSYTSGRSLSVARELMFSLLGLVSDSPNVTAAALRQHLETQSPIAAANSYPYLARLLELPLDSGAQEQVALLSGEALQTRMFESFRDYVHHRAQQPLVLVWEDLHWSDPSSLQLLEEVVPLVTAAPLLIICVSRLENTTSTRLLADLRQRVPENASWIELRPLDSQQSNSLVEALLKIENLPAHTRALIIDRAEGNPFYIEELLRSLLDAGAIAVGANGPQLVSDVQAIEIPATLEGVLHARIDRLEPHQKATLQKASVIGRIFNRHLLQWMMTEGGHNEWPIDRILAELQERQFVESREEQGAETHGLNADEFIFKHAITHDTVYQSLLRSTRRQLHHVVARAFEELFPDRLADLSPTLGYHFERAEVFDRAADYLSRAADASKTTFANAEAIGFYESAIRAAQRLPEVDVGYCEVIARLSENLGDVLTCVAEHEKARTALERALQMTAEANLIPRARLLRKIGVSHSLQRHFSATEQAFAAAERELEPGARDASWWEEKVYVQLERMHLFYWQGMVAEMRRISESYHAAIETHGSATQQTKFLKMLALGLLMESQFRPSAECVAFAQNAVKASESIHDHAEVCYVRFTLGLIQVFRSEPAEAIAALSEALELAQRIGERVLESRCLTYIALANRRLGNVDHARAFAERTLAFATKLEMPEYIAMSKANLAWVGWKENRFDDCQVLSEEALKLWHDMKDPYSMDWIALWPLIAVALANGRVEQALDFARGLFAESQHPLEDEVMLETKRAIDLWDSGEHAAACLQFEKAQHVAEHHRYI
jgi:class 3 adenylate cyclase/tetratricopeptide (TPR) repeat protein